MGELIISAISALVSAASVAWGMWTFVVKRNDEREKDLRQTHQNEMNELKKNIDHRLDDFDKMLGRNSNQFAQMREAFAVYRSKLDEFQKSFEKRMDKTDREVEKIDAKMDSWGSVVRRDG